MIAYQTQATSVNSETPDIDFNRTTTHARQPDMSTSWENTRLYVINVPGKLALFQLRDRYQAGRPFHASVTD